MQNRTNPIVARWSDFSLRGRITFLTIALIAGGLLLSGIGTHQMLRNYLYAQVDSQLIGAAKAFSSTPASNAIPTFNSVRGLLPNAYFAAYYDDAGSYLGALGPRDTDASALPKIPSMTRAAVMERAGEPFTVKAGGPAGSWRLIATSVVSGGTVVVGLPLYGPAQTLTLYDNIFLSFGVLVLLAAGIAAWWLAGTLFAPLRRAGEHATAVAAGRYSERLLGENPKTEVGRLNSALNSMTDDIEQAFGDRSHTIEQMRRFVADASHELRTPLVSVRGYAELYRMGALQTDDDVAKAMDRIEKEAVRMGGLVEDLLELARLDETKPLALTRVDLRVLAHDAALDASARERDRTVTAISVAGDDTDATAAPASEQHPVAATVASPAAAKPKTRSGRQALMPSILRSRKSTEAAALAALAHDANEIETAADLPPEPIVLGQEDKLRQVIINLVGNALRYTPEGSPIEIGVGVDQSARTGFIQVQDHGPGVPPQIREKIFQRFWRADSSRARDTGGSGLGLAIVAAIVKAHDGNVTVSETHGGGATFRVDIPLDPSLTSAEPEQLALEEVGRD